MYVIGLMSGTSADAVDAALVEWPDAELALPFRLVAFREFPLPKQTRDRIHGLGSRSETALEDLSRLDVEMGELFGAAATALIKESGMAPRDVAAVASHGQTVAHHPEHKASLQIGNASVIAERTGCCVISDFRSRDLAAGGEGAPLAPFFHHAVLASATENRLVLNLGGIANVTWLPRNGAPDDVIAFDVGPANVLIDEVVRIYSDGREHMDRDGRRALRGRVDTQRLDELLDDSFLERPPPRSTGRERYGRQEAMALVERWRSEQRAEEDLVATLVAFTATAVQQAAVRWLPKGGVDRLLVGGGGAANPALMAALVDGFSPAPCEPLDSLGVPLAAAEAMAFSLLGRNALLGIPNHLPRTTGAKHPLVLGNRTPA